MNIFHHKRAGLLALICGLITFLFVNIYSLSYNVIAISDDYWKGQIDSRMNENEKRDIVIFQKLESIEKDIKSICADITEVKIQAAKNGGIYGGAVGGGIYIISLLIQNLIRLNKKNNQDSGSKLSSKNGK